MATLLLDCVPDDLEVDADGDGYIVTAPACECDDGLIYVTLDCRLDPMPDSGPDTFEFSYGFTVSETDGGTITYFTQDRFEVERYFDGNTREYVLPTVCEALEMLVQHVQPAYIYRVSKGRDLPQKALAKHLLVSETLIDLGFQGVDNGTDAYDRLFWLMAR